MVVKIVGDMEVGKFVVAEVGVKKGFIVGTVDEEMLGTTVRTVVSLLLGAQDGLFVR